MHLLMCSLQDETGERAPADGLSATVDCSQSHAADESMKRSLVDASSDVDAAGLDIKRIKTDGLWKLLLLSAYIQTSAVIYRKQNQSLSSVRQTRLRQDSKAVMLRERLWCRVCFISTQVVYRCTLWTCFIVSVFLHSCACFITVWQPSL